MLRRLGQQLGRDADLDVLGEEHDPHRGMAPADLVRGLDPLVGLRRRHADVHDRHVGLVLVDRGEQLLRRPPPRRRPRCLRRARTTRCPRATAGCRRRSRRARQLRGDHGPGTGRAEDAQRAVERGDPVRQPLEAGAGRLVGAADAVVGDLDRPPRRCGARPAPTPSVAWAYLATLASASQATKYAASSTGSGRRSGLWKETVVGTLAREASESSAAFRPWLSTAGWIPRASSRSSSSDWESSSPADLEPPRPAPGRSGRGARIMRSWSATETSRCCAPSWRLRSSRRRSASPAATRRSREARSSREPLLGLRLQPRVVERDRGRGRDGLHELRIVVERRVVDEHRELAAVALDRRGRPGRRPARAARPAVRGRRGRSARPAPGTPARGPGSPSTLASPASSRTPRSVPSSRKRSASPPRASRERSRPQSSAAGTVSRAAFRGQYERVDRRARRGGS